MPILAPGSGFRSKLCGVSLAAMRLFAPVRAHARMAQCADRPSCRQPPPPASLAPRPRRSRRRPHRHRSAGGGLIEKLGDWLRDSADGVSSGLKGTQQRIDDINKGTLDTLSRIPVAGFASGRSLCPRAANGAPDCYAATDKLCKEKGYTRRPQPRHRVGGNLQPAHLSAGLSAQGRRLPDRDVRDPRGVPIALTAHPPP